MKYINGESIYNNRRRIVLCVICILLGAICWKCARPLFDSLHVFDKTMEYLDEKRKAALTISASLAGTSFGVALVPGDATTPMANQIMQLSSYMVVALGAIMLEKYFLTIVSLIVFVWFFPIAFVMMAVGAFLIPFRRLAISLFAIGMVLLVSIPIGSMIGMKIDESFGTDKMIENVVADLEEFEEDNPVSDPSGGETEEAAPEPEKKGIWDTITGFGKDVKENVDDIGETLKQGASVRIEELKIILENLLNVVAALLITACAIPVLTFLCMYWISKLLVRTVNDAFKDLARMHREH